jgi:hypothetical protein
MIICDEAKFIFIHIPKNSGTSMSNELIKKYKNSQLIMSCERTGNNIGIDKMHLYYDTIYNFIPKNIVDTYIKFCIIRNPYNKLYSAWFFIKERHGYNNVNDFIKYKLDEQFIYGKELIPGDARVHYRPQFTFIYDSNGYIYVDYIIRYENLNDDIKLLNYYYNLSIPEYGNNTNKDYTQLFNKESIKKINILYRKDFILFNYKML